MATYFPPSGVVKIHVLQHTNITNFKIFLFGEYHDQTVDGFPILDCNQQIIDFIKYCKFKNIKLFIEGGDYEINKDDNDDNDNDEENILPGQYLQTSFLRCVRYFCTRQMPCLRVDDRLNLINNILGFKNSVFDFTSGLAILRAMGKGPPLYQYYLNETTLWRFIDIFSILCIRKLEFDTELVDLYNNRMNNLQFDLIWDYTDIYLLTQLIILALKFRESSYDSWSEFITEEEYNQYYTLGKDDGYFKTRIPIFFPSSNILSEYCLLIEIILTGFSTGELFIVNNIKKNITFCSKQQTCTDKFIYIAGEAHTKLLTKLLCNQENGFEIINRWRTGRDDDLNITKMFKSFLSDWPGPLQNEFIQKYSAGLKLYSPEKNIDSNYIDKLYISHHSHESKYKSLPNLSNYKINDVKKKYSMNKKHFFNLTKTKFKEEMQNQWFYDDFKPQHVYYQIKLILKKARSSSLVNDHTKQNITYILEVL